MSVWDIYNSRITLSGKSKREAFLNRERHMLNSKHHETLSSHNAVIDGVEYDKREVIITDTSNFYEKTIYSNDTSIFKNGSFVEWMNCYWLITECDANSEVYQKAKMTQCNYLLKWIDKSGEIHEQWCIIEDGTKYMTGEYEDRNFIVTRGDSRIVMTIAKNINTVKFNRESRFLIDDPDADIKLSYALTKPLKIGKTYNNDGVYCFVLQEVSSTDDDNHELSIADYYKYIPRPNNVSSDQTTDTDTNDGKTRWF